MSATTPTKKVHDAEDGPAAAEQGWTPFPERNMTIKPNGQVVSGHWWVSEFTDQDGTVYRDTPEDHRRRQEKHKAHALAFQARVTDERLGRARGSARSTGARPSRPGRLTVANRARRTVRTAAPTRGDPDDPDPEPAWQDLDEWLSERRQALAEFSAQQLRLDGEVGS